MTDIISIIRRWPSRREMAADAGVDTVAVHRWAQRGSIPGRHDAALLAAARKRGIELSAEELATYRATSMSSSHAPAAGGSQC